MRILPLITVCLLLLALLAVQPAEARLWIIYKDGSGAASTIQAGIDSAAVGDSVLLEGGVWHARDITMKSGIFLLGIGGLEETPRPEYTTIDADGQGRCINCNDLTGASTIKALTFRDGVAPLVPAHNFEAGGAIYVSNSSLTITDCVFQDNHSDFIAGGIFSEYSFINLENCSFEHNSADASGGSMVTEGNADHASLVNCTFVENSAAVRGGAIAADGVTLTGCLFLRNEVGDFGYGADISCDAAYITNCTFVANPGSFRLAIWGGYLWLSKTIFANCGIGGTAEECSVSATCCDFYPNSGFYNCQNYGSPDTFSLDPQFCDAAADNYTLMQSSPCAPGNHPQGTDCGLIGAQSVGCQDTPVEATTWGHIKTMFR